MKHHLFGLIPLLGIIYLVLLLLPATSQQEERAMLWVERQTYATLPADSDTLFILLPPDTAGHLPVGFDRQSLPHTLTEGRFLSRSGAFITASDNRREALDSTRWQEVLHHTIVHLQERQSILSRQLESKTRYDAEHINEDLSYTMMEAFYHSLDSLSTHNTRLLQALNLLSQKSQPQFHEALVVYFGGRTYPAECLYQDRTALTGRLLQHLLPDEAYPLPLSLAPLSLLQQIPPAFLPADTLRTGRPALPGGYQAHPLPDVKVPLRDWPAVLRQWCKSLCQGHELPLATALPFAADSLVTDSLGRQIRGIWEGNLLSSGTIHYPDGSTYEGYLHQLQPAGKGTFHAPDGLTYQGFWEEGQYHGFGIEVTADGQIRAGEWKAGRYQGERLTHSRKRAYGIDISRHQHKYSKTIHWDQLMITHLGSRHKDERGDALPLPISYILIKATEGKNIVNPYFLKDYTAARKHGYVCGAYHFFSSAPVQAQIRNFIRTARVQKGDMPPILDLEPSQKQIRKMGGEMAMLRNALQWLKAIEAHYGIRPILYVSQTFVKETLSKAPADFRQYHFWIARYSSFKPTVHVDFWQIAPDGRVQGIKGPVDINLYKGTIPQFKTFVQNHGR